MSSSYNGTRGRRGGDPLARRRMGGRRRGRSRAGPAYGRKRRRPCARGLRSAWGQRRPTPSPLHPRMRVPRPRLPLTLSLSPSGGEGIGTAPSPSERERVGVRVAPGSRIIRASPLHSRISSVPAGPSAGRRRRLAAFFVRYCPARRRETDDESLRTGRHEKIPRMRGSRFPFLAGYEFDT